MQNPNKKIAVIGTGHWGRNLVRNFQELGVLSAICDIEPQNLRGVQQAFNLRNAFMNYQELFTYPEIDAVVISTPAATHYEITKAALKAGKDVFVEKPLALKTPEAEELLKLSEAQKRILMVDHLLQYHPAVLKLKELIDSGKVGKLLYIYSHRLNIGRLRTAENILWSFAPHDISVILSLTNKEPKKIKVFGEAYVQDHVYDTTITDLTFDDRLKAHIYVSWLHPFKEQKLVVIGNYGMAVFNDMESEEKLTLYPHKIEWIKQMPVAAKANKEVIPVEQKEPLKEACQHFLECIEKRKTPRTDGREALTVLQILQAAQEYLDHEHKEK